MNSTTADPGCRSGALARLDVCADANSAVEAMTSSCVLTGVHASNSTTLLVLGGRRACSIQDFWLCLVVGVVVLWWF
jgi:preprotein translocase subunit SecF